MPYKHYYICLFCKRHVVSYTDQAMPVQPGRTHQEALQNDAEPMGQLNPQDQHCMGQLIYCSGVDKMGRPCGGNHTRGTEESRVVRRPPPDPEWIAFEQRVGAAWTAFVQSGYQAALRGPNHDRKYRAPQNVLRRLQQAGGSITVGGLLYTIAPSRTSQVALHRPIPGGHQQGYMQSFIFHL